MSSDWLKNNFNQQIFRHLLTYNNWRGTHRWKARYICIRTHLIIWNTCNDNWYWCIYLIGHNDENIWNKNHFYAIKKDILFDILKLCLLILKRNQIMDQSTYSNALLWCKWKSEMKCTFEKMFLQKVIKLVPFHENSLKWSNSKEYTPLFTIMRQ